MWPVQFADFPFADYSSAAPWIGAGFAAGFIFYALIRFIFGVDRRRKRALSAATATVEEMRSAGTALAKDKARLEAGLAEAAPRAALATRLEQEVVQLRHIEGVRQTSLDTAAKQLLSVREESADHIAGLRQDAETHSGTAKYYEGEFSRLFAEHGELKRSAEAQAHQLLKLKADLEHTTRGASDAVTLRGDLAFAKAESESLRADLQTHVAAARTFKDQLAAATSQSTSQTTSQVVSDGGSNAAAQIAAHANEIASLKAQLAAMPQAAAQGGIDPEMYETDIAALRGTVDDLRKELAAAQAALEQSRTAAAGAPQGGIDPEMYESDVAALRGTADELRKELAAAQADLEKSRAAAASAPQGGIDPEMYESDVSALRSTADDLRKELAQAQSALEQGSLFASEKVAEIERLKARLGAAVS